MPPKGVKELTAEEAAIQDEGRLLRLQREYNIMEKTRNMTQHKKLDKQYNVIRIYQKEDRNIMANLKVATNSTKQKQDVKTMRKLRDVLETYEYYDEKTKVMQDYLRELDRQIYLRQHEVLELQNLQTNEQEHQKRVANAIVTLEKLENKLDVQVTKFGKTCTENRALRDTLTSLLHERDWFNKTWNKLVKNLVDGKRIMVDLIEQATLAYDEREEWVSKLILLRKRERVALAHNIASMCVLERNRHNVTKLKEFLATKNQRRIIKDLRLKGMKRRKLFLQDLQIQCDRYKEILNNIYQFTNEEVVDHIAKRFRLAEASNFSNFQKIITLNKDMEHLTEELFEISDRIDNQRMNYSYFEIKQTKNLATLEQRLQEVSKENKEMVDEYNQEERKLQILIRGVDSLFKQLKCSNESLLNLLGDNTEVNKFNILLYLTLVEEKFFEYVLSGDYVPKTKVRSSRRRRRDSTVSQSNIALVDDYVRSAPCPLCIENEEVHDIVDVLQKVRTKEETQQYLIERMNLPDGENLMHHVSQCVLPQSRAIMQMRYQ